MTAWIAETLVTVTALMLLVLALRRPVARMFGAGWSYALWAIPALRLVLPPVAVIRPEIQLPAAFAATPALAAAAPSGPLGAQAASLGWGALLLAVWAGGAILFLTLQWLGYRAFVKRLRSGARPARPARHQGFAAMISPAVDGPLALGFLERLIVLPGDFSRRYSADERRLAIQHEVTHHRRFDTWWNLLALIVLALNWFNPVAWMAFRAFRADQELACDAAVAAGASPDERHDYARAMVKSASRPGLIAACPLNEAAQLKRRLRMMGTHRVTPARKAGGAAALTAMALTGFAVGAPAFTQHQAEPATAAARAPAVFAEAVPAPVSPSAPAARALEAPSSAPAPAPSAPASPARALAAAPAAPAAAPVPALPPEPAEPTEAPRAPVRLAEMQATLQLAADSQAALDRLLPRLAALSAQLEGRSPPRVTVAVPAKQMAARLRGMDGKVQFVLVHQGPRPLDRHAMARELRRAVDAHRRGEKATLRLETRTVSEPGGNFSNVQVYTIEQGETKK